MKLPKEYLVKCNSEQETNIVSLEITKEPVNCTWGLFIVSPELKTSFSCRYEESSLPVKYEKLPKFTFKQWKELFYQKEFVLPERWCIKWGNKENSIIIQEYLESKDPEKKNWIHSHTAHDDAFVDYKNSYYSYHSEAPSGFTEITFEQFKKYVLKQEETMTKQDFTIEGSEALKKAFVEESGLTDNFSDLTGQEYYLTSKAMCKGFHVTSRKKPKHFILPSQWEEALQYVKEYFAKDEFNVGDKVVILTNGLGGALNINSVGTITKKDNSTSFQVEGHDKHSKLVKWQYSNNCIRFASPEEIKASKAKSFILGAFTAVVTEDKITIADRGSLTHDECITLVRKLNRASFNVGSFEIHSTYNTIDIGCVKNIPFKDIVPIYDYIISIQPF